MASIIVAIVCNLIAVLILVSGILTTVKAGIRVAGTRLFFTIASCVGAFFLTPVVSDLVLGVTVAEATETVEAICISNIIANLGISIASVNSVMYLIIFFAFYLFGTAICNIVKHVLIKGVRKGTINKARIKRAKSINAKAEKIAKKAEWKEMVKEYKVNMKWWGKLISTFMGIISSVLVGFVVLTPYNFVAKDIVAQDETKQFLLDGFDYTLNGIIEDKINFDFDGWLVNAQEIPMDPETPEVPEIKE